MKSSIALIALLTLATAAPALAHSPRGPSPLARLDALAMPGLAPARGLMAEMLHGHPAPRAVLPEVTARQASPLFWGWFRAPVRINRHDTARCEVVYSPYAGRIETCGPAPRVRPVIAPPRDER